MSAGRSRAGAASNMALTQPRPATTPPGLSSFAPPLDSWSIRGRHSFAAVRRAPINGTSAAECVNRRSGASNNP